jgi:hypothetical protein
MPAWNHCSRLTHHETRGLAPIRDNRRNSLHLLAFLRLSLALLIAWHGAEVTVTLIVALEVKVTAGRHSGEGDDLVTFENLYFGYSDNASAATEWYPEPGAVPAWWSLPWVPSKVRAQQMGVDSRGFAVP